MSNIYFFLTGSRGLSDVGDKVKEMFVEIKEGMTGFFLAIVIIVSFVLVAVCFFGLGTCLLTGEALKRCWDR
jgi:hypothetical protein